MKTIPSQASNLDILKIACKQFYKSIGLNGFEMFRILPRIEYVDIAWYRIPVRQLFCLFSCGSAALFTFVSPNHSSFREASCTRVWHDITVSIPSASASHPDGGHQFLAKMGQDVCVCVPFNSCLKRHPSPLAQATSTNKFVRESLWCDWIQLAYSNRHCFNVLASLMPALYCLISSLGSHRDSMRLVLERSRVE